MSLETGARQFVTVGYGDAFINHRNRHLVGLLRCFPASSDIYSLTRLPRAKRSHQPAYMQRLWLGYSVQRFVKLRHLTCVL